MTCVIVDVVGNILKVHQDILTDVFDNKKMVIIMNRELSEPLVTKITTKEKNLIKILNEATKDIRNYSQAVLNRKL